MSSKIKINPNRIAKIEAEVKSFVDTTNEVPEFHKGYILGYIVAFKKAYKKKKKQIMA